MALSRIFLCSDERRLRSGWRLILQYALMTALGITLSPLTLLLGSLAFPGRSMGDVAEEFSKGSNTIALLIGLGITACAVTVSAYLARRVLDRRSFRSLGLEATGAARGLLFGFLVAALMMAAIFAAEWALGWLRFEGLAWQTGGAPPVAGNLLIWLAVFVIVGWHEELLCRGYWLRNLTDGLNVPLAVFLSSLGFALMHLGNPNVSWTAIVGLLAAGGWFAYAALATKQLWAPMGAHIGWNFFEATVFGFPVSGLNTFGLLRQSSTGPGLWTGGLFGPEAGLIVLPALLLGTFFVWWGYGRKRA